MRGALASAMAAFVALLATEGAVAQDTISTSFGAAGVTVKAVGGGMYNVEVQVDTGNDDDDQWLAFGVGQGGSTTCGMPDSSLVVGRLCSSDTCGSDTPVQMYETNGRSGVSVNSNGGPLSEASITKSGTVLTLGFTTDVIGEELLDDVQCVVWASGLLTSSTANDHITKHSIKGSNNALVFADLTSVTTAAPTEPGETAAPTSAVVPTLDPTAAPTTVTTSAPTVEPTEATAGVLTGIGGNLEINYSLVDESQVRFVMRYAMTSGWMAMGLSSGGRMIGSRAVLGGTGVNGLPAEVGEYVLTEYAAPSLFDGASNLTDTSVTVADGVMEVSFTTSAIAGEALDISGGGNRIVFAVYEGSNYGPNHGSNFGDSGALVDWASTGVSSGEDAKDLTNLYLAHGVLMILAFGILFPMGTVPSALRHKISPGPRWFHFHRAIQSTALLLALSAFGIGIYFVEEGSGDHFDELHKQLGLAVVVVTCCQPAFALFRKGKGRPLWRISHYLFAMFIFAGGIANCYEGLDEVEGFLEDSEQNALEVLVYVGTAVTVIAVALIFAMAGRRGCKPHPNPPAPHAAEPTRASPSKTAGPRENAKTEPPQESQAHDEAADSSGSEGSTAQPSRMNMHNVALV